MDTQNNGFAALRSQILQQAMPLLESADIPAEDRFRLSLQIAQNEGSYEAYEKAFRVAQSIEAEARLGAYMELLGEVDYVMQGDDDGTQAPQQAVEQQSEPIQPDGNGEGQQPAGQQ